MNNIGFANGYNLFVKPSFGSNVPSGATRYLQQFLGDHDDVLVETLADVASKRKWEVNDYNDYDFDDYDL